MAQDWRYGLCTTVISGRVASDATAMSAAGDNGDFFFSTAPLSNISTNVVNFIGRGLAGVVTFAHVSDHQPIVDDDRGGSSLAGLMLGASSKNFQFHYVASAAKPIRAGLFRAAGIACGGNL